MTDVLTKEQRKLNMSRIKGKDTAPELKIRKMLYANGLRGYRVHYNLLGKPDIVFTKKRIAIFIDGCYWHKCPVCFKEPQTNHDFWMNKINSNVKRDQEVNNALLSDGWTVLRFWEHEIRKEPEEVVKKIASTLNTPNTG